MDKPLNIPYQSITDEDISKIQNMTPEQRVEYKKELLKSVGITPTQKGAYLDYIHSIQHLNNETICNDLSVRIHSFINDNLFLRRFLMAICL